MSQPSEQTANSCYRHPERESYVLCQRCGRTICPQCQTQAAVGVVCPECMREQRASAPRRRSPVLSRVRRVATQGEPVATYALIAVCVIVYIAQLIPSLGVTDALQYAGLYSMPETGAPFQPWRMLTALFVHSPGSVLHILLNMYTLWIFGRVLEPLLGSGRFLVLYLLSGLAGSLGVLLLADPRIAVVGASGAIFGLIGAFFVIQRRLGGNSTQLLILIGINVVMVFFLPQIAWQAHLGGILAGAIVGLIYVETRERSRRTLQTLLLAVFAAILVVASCWHLLV